MNPESYYSSEPAPMGIADFGVDASLNAYSYQTTEFVGTTTLRSLLVTGSGSPSSGVTIQLNVVLTFQSGPNFYAFWIQDVPFIDTATNKVTLENNIWNLSGSSGLYSSTLSGTNGSILTYGSSNFYAALATNQPGNGAYLTYPATIALRVYAQNALGKPTVQFDYNDGYHWQRYDTVTFGFPTAASQVAFTVDGNNFNPSSLYYDAEQTLGGPGGGSSTTATAANLSMSIQFWNGHNLQEIPNAWNFGSNTAETISGLTENQTVNSLNGSLFAHITHGSGSLGTVYTRNYAAILNASPAGATGSLKVNLTTGVPFTGTDVNLTMAPGNYALGVYVGGVLRQNGTITLSPGEYLAYNFRPIAYYDITFTSVGLPGGTPWSVQVNNSVKQVSGRTVTVHVEAGSYPFVVGPVSGWSPTPSSGTVNAQSSSQSVNILWTAVLYALTFDSAGLPPGTRWGINLSGLPLYSTGTGLSMNEPNGSYAWTAIGVPGYLPTPSSSVVQVMDGPSTVSLIFTQNLYSVRFSEQGLPTGTPWSVLVNGTSRFSSGTLVSLQLPNGSYVYSVPEASSYTATPAIGSFSVAGNNSVQVIVFRPLPATLSGAVHPGTLSLFVNDTLVTVAPDGSYSIQLKPGTYNISAKLTGYFPYSQIVTVTPGDTIQLNITLRPMPHTAPQNTTSSSGIPTIDILAGVAVFAALLVVALALVRRQRPPTPPGK